MNCCRLRASFQSRNVSSSRVALKPVYCTLSAGTMPPAAGGASTSRIGPSFRRGTMIVSAGTLPPGGACTRKPPALKKNCSGIRSTGSNSPLKIVATGVPVAS